MFPNVGVPCLSVLSYYDIKKLYSFFDKFGIYLTVETYTKGMWGYTISLSDGRVFCPIQESKTNRESTEVEGFYECFKLLEKNLSKEINVVYEDDEWFLLKPLTLESSVKYGYGTKWCTASKDHSEPFYEYSSRGILIYIINLL
jgi:hypothetical protein